MYASYQAVVPNLPMFYIQAVRMVGLDRKEGELCLWCIILELERGYRSLGNVGHDTDLWWRSSPPILRRPGRSISHQTRVSQGILNGVLDKPLLDEIQ
jgi:hypothetical protein